MKKLTILGMMALLCAVACQREKVAEVNPTYNPETNEVTAEFIMSVATNRNAKATKMTAADVQNDSPQTFRGMDKVHLLTYNLDYTGVNGEAYLYKDLFAEDTQEKVNPNKATRDYNLSYVLRKNEISADQSSKVLEISLPLQTNAVLIYGIAPKTKTDDEQGAVTLGGTPLGNTVSSIDFSLNQRGNMDAYDQFTDLIGRILTGILRSGKIIETAGQGSTVSEDNRCRFWWPIDATSEVWNKNKEFYYIPEGQTEPVEITPGNTSYHAGYTYYRVAKTWRDYGVAYAALKADPSNPDKQMSGMELILGEMYQAITTIKTNGKNKDDVDYQQELRAGSCQDVFSLSAGVYSMLLTVEKGNITSPDDYVAAQVAAEIHNRAKEFFREIDGQMTWISLDDMKNVVDKRLPDRTWKDNYNLITDDFFNRGSTQPGFPMNMGLPAGAALMSFMKVGGGTNVYDVVYYLKDIPSYGMGGGTVPVANYRYPAELMYWTNSSLRTTDNDVNASKFPVTVEGWDAETWSFPSVTWKSKSRVQSTTRGVAVTKEINYGTALLETRIKYSDTKIYDNNSGIHPGEKDNEINVATGSKFIVTGIIIGGVDDTVGWNFLPKNNSFTKLLYDRFASGEDLAFPPNKALSSPVYTMTWDNYNGGSTTGQLPVYIALEIVNNSGKDIWGGLNLIRTGGTFYMVGKLDPSAATIPSTMKDDQGNLDLSRDNFHYPPYDADGKTINTARVFMQDFVTSATFTFNPHSLRNAYVTMPDLRASNVSLGLSVDLTWTPGLQFNDVPLGGIPADAE